MIFLFPKPLEARVALQGERASGAGRKRRWMEMVMFWKVVYRTHPTDFEAGVDDETLVGTKGYCDHTPGYEHDVVEDGSLKESELEKFANEVVGELERAFKEKEEVSIQVVHRPLGHCYSNNFYYGIRFEHEWGEFWRATPYRGANTWGGVWLDIGGTGYKEDSPVVVTERQIQDLIEEFAENPEDFDIDIGEFIRDADENADIRVYNLWDIEEYFDEPGEGDKALVLEVWDDEDTAMYVVKDVELTDQLREEILDFIVDTKGWDEEEDEEYIETRRLLNEAKTLAEFLKKYSEKYSY